MKLTATAEWQAITPDNDEIWQVQYGAMRITDAAPVDEYDGFIIRAGHETAYRVTAGTTYHIRSDGSDKAHIWRGRG